MNEHRATSRQAVCHDCGKEWWAKNAHPVAKKHAATYGHRVEVAIEQVFYYNFPVEDELSYTPPTQGEQE